MARVEELKRLVSAIDAKTIPSESDWKATELELGLRMPGSFKELINAFGHGIWGRDLVFLHPKGSGSQCLNIPNLLEVKNYVDAGFAAKMPNQTIARWSIVRIGRLPYRAHIFQDLTTEEIIRYDGDYLEECRTGCTGPVEFILKSIRWRETELPEHWNSFTEANWPVGMPTFTARCESRPGGFFALLGPN